MVLCCFSCQTERLRCSAWLSDREAEVSHHNQQLAALNAELADERETGEDGERGRLE